MENEEDNAPLVGQDSLIKIGAAIADITAVVAIVGEAWKKSLEKHLPALGFVSRFGSIFDGIPEEIEKSIKVLAEHGWFVDMEASLSWPAEIRVAVEEEGLEKAEEVLKNHFRNRASDIEKSLVSAYPHREHLISEAFWAHNNQRYALSIPVFLAQADGICHEILKSEYFDPGRRQDAIKRYMESHEADFLEAYVTPFMESTPIDMSRKRREEMGNPAFNRHRILHGDDIEYATEENSLRAISFINYVATVFMNSEQWEASKLASE